jgi:ribonuclease G
MGKGKATIAEEILVNVENRETRVAYLHHGRLHDLVVERKKTKQMRGNIYRGSVKNILQNIQSAFIDIGEPENGFIHVSDIMENRKKLEQTFDMDFDAEFDVTAPEGEAEIDKVLKVDDAVIVQVVKEAIGTKGARLTSRLSIPGRYLVLLPNTPHCGVSRKIEDRPTRERLKRVVRAFKLPKGMGVICRTISQSATDEALLDEAEDLLATWEQIREKFQEAARPTLLNEESDLLKRTVLQAVDTKIGRILIDDFKTYQRCKKLYERYAEEHPLRIEYYRDKVPMYERFNVEREIDRALRRKIWLTGGGYLYFDRTEAMYTIDVNSGRSGGEGSGNVEETLVQINLDAAEEIASQLRIRNIGGLVICDFIDMRSRKNRRRVLDRLRDCMKADGAKCTILGMSDFGLVEMTRQRSRESLAQTLYEECPYCQGKGTIRTKESVSIDLERSLKRLIQVQQQFGIRIVCHPYLLAYIEKEDKQDLVNIADELNCQLEFAADDAFHLNDVRFFSSITGKELEG